MTLLYDTDIPGALPAGVLAAGYCTGYAAAAWSGPQGFPRFPGARRINVFASVDEGDTFDVESKDITPAQAPGCVQRAHRRGIAVPWVYCNRANGPAVEGALRGAGIGRDQVLLWVATLDGTQIVTHWNNGLPVYYRIAAVQFLNAAHSGGHYDISVVDDLYGVAVQGGSSMALIDDIHSAVARVEVALGTALPDASGPAPADQRPNYLGWSRDVSAALADLKKRVELIEQSPAIGAEHTTPPGP